MSTHESHREASRFEALEIANGDVLIYDVTDHGAWIQSDAAVDREEMA